MTNEEIKKRVQELLDIRAEEFKRHAELITFIDRQIEYTQMQCNHDEYSLVSDPCDSWNQCDICQASIKYINNLKKRKENEILFR